MTPSGSQKPQERRSSSCCRASSHGGRCWPFPHPCSSHSPPHHQGGVACHHQPLRPYCCRRSDGGRSSCPSESLGSPHGSMCVTVKVVPVQQGRFRGPSVGGGAGGQTGMPSSAAPLAGPGAAASRSVSSAKPGMPRWPPCRDADVRGFLRPCWAGALTDASQQRKSGLAPADWLPPSAALMAERAPKRWLRPAASFGLAVATAVGRHSGRGPQRPAGPLLYAVDAWGAFVSTPQRPLRLSYL